MTDAPLTPEELDEALAAEFVLGVLDPTERAMAEQRIKREPGFAGLVAAWETRMDGLNDDFAAAAAPNLMPAIEARLFPTPKRKGRLAQAMSWFAGAAVAALLALVVIAVVAPPKSVLVATLATADNRLAYEVAQVGTTLKVTRVAGRGAAPGLDHELWLIAPGKAPASLGLLEETPLFIDQPVPPAGWVLAVSLEPEGGSTSGLPSGPVILTAEIGT